MVLVLTRMDEERRTFVGGGGEGAARDFVELRFVVLFYRACRDPWPFWLLVVRSGFEY